MDIAKELIRLASLVGTDAKDPNSNLLNFVNEHFIEKAKVIEAIGKDGVWGEGTGTGLDASELDGIWARNHLRAEIKKRLGVDK